MTLSDGELRPRVLLLGEEAVALAEALEREGYETRVGRGADALEEEVYAAAPDAAIVAVGASEAAVRSAVTRLRAREGFRFLPILLVASRELLDGPLASIFGAMTEGQLSPVSRERLSRRLKAHLEIRRLLDDSDKRAARLLSLVEISRAVNSTLDSGAILYSIARKLGETMDLVRCSFIVPDLANGIGRVIACKDDPNIAALEINLANYPEIIHVLRSGRRAIIADVETDPIMAGIRKFADVFRDQSIMTLPLRIHGETIGVLQIRKKSQRSGFTEREIEYCELLATAAASALKNAQLYEDIERHNRDLRHRKRELEDLSEELRRKNQELVELQQLKEDFTAMLVHDLRSPLMIVQGVLDILRHRGAASREEKELVDDGIAVTKRILELVNHLLDVSRLESGEVRLEAEPLDFAALVSAAVEPYRALAVGRSISLDCRVEPGLPAVHGDRRGLSQVVDNLVGNAFKFTPEGGRIAVHAAAEPSGAEVVLVVEDSGEGIPAEELPNIFKKFHQGRKSLRKGSGLGLTIVDLMVRAHGGTVRAESEPGRGSRFVVRLPLGAAAGSPAAPRPAGRELAHNG